MQSQKTIGIIGGGQLGKMLIAEGMRFPITFHVLDPDPNAPCSEICKNFSLGDIKNYEDVYSFGLKCDIITIEIENVNTEALKSLKAIGKTVIPNPDAIEIILDKGIQKQFFTKNNFPTSSYQIIENPQIDNINIQFPFFLKVCKGGYDGKGVLKINNQLELKNSFNTQSVAEELVKCKKEISVIVAANHLGEIKAFNPVESVFESKRNLVDYLISPADIGNEKCEEAKEIAKEVIRKLNMTGILAVEFFLTENDDLLLNEIAPRPHNSGHQTIEANITSQYEQLIRCLLNLPLGDTGIVKKSAMINILGGENSNGDVSYYGIEEISKIPEVYIHLYGKKIVKPFRKMGHITILENDSELLHNKIQIIKQLINC